MLNASDLIERLTQEMSMKKLSGGRPVGFLAQAACPGLSDEHINPC